MRPRSLERSEAKINYKVARISFIVLVHPTPSLQRPFRLQTSKSNPSLFYIKSIKFKFILFEKTHVKFSHTFFRTGQIPRLSIKGIKIGGLATPSEMPVFCNRIAIFSGFYTVQNMKIATSALARSNFYKLTILRFKLHRFIRKKTLIRNMAMKSPSVHNFGRYNPRKNELFV